VIKLPLGMRGCAVFRSIFGLVVTLGAQHQTRAEIGGFVMLSLLCREQNRQKSAEREVHEPHERSATS
jgi:hypothetical protein